MVEGGVGVLALDVVEPLTGFLVEVVYGVLAVFAVLTAGLVVFVFLGFGVALGEFLELEAAVAEYLGCYGPGCGDFYGHVDHFEDAPVVVGYAVGKEFFVAGSGVLVGTGDAGTPCNEAFGCEGAAFGFDEGGGYCYESNLHGTY